MTKIAQKTVRIFRFGVCAVLALSLTSTLTACSSTDENPSETTPTAMSESEAVASAMPTPSTPAPVLDESNPIYQACTDLISIQALYDFNPNYSYDASKTPATGSLGESAETKSGVYCGYVNLSSGDVIEVSAAKISDASLSSWTKKVTESSRPTDAYGVSPTTLGFFSRSNGEGVAQAISGPNWVAIVSESFFEPEDAAPLMAQVLNSLSG